MMTVIHAALAYAARGKCIFPCNPRNKKPLTDHGFKDASSDPDLVRQWWSKWPSAMIGVPTGKISGVWVLDVDPRHNGEESLKFLEQQHSSLPATVEAITGGGGRHLYFRMPEGIEVKCSAGDLGAGLDVRGDGGYVIAPPSIHPNGKPYTWSVDCAPLANAPTWLLELTPRQGERRPDSHWEGIAERGLPDGMRNETLLSVIGKLIGAGINAALAHELVQSWNIVRGDPPENSERVTQLFNRVVRLERKKREAALC
jgi:hypothetical protein